MPHIVVRLEGAEYIREEDGRVTERRAATNSESTILPPPEPTPSDVVVSTIRERVTIALESNRAFLNIASPTNAQNAAQVKSLTRQINGIIRLVLNQIDSDD